MAYGVMLLTYSSMNLTLSVADVDIILRSTNTGTYSNSVLTTWSTVPTCVTNYEGDEVPIGLMCALRGSMTIMLSTFLFF